MANQRFQIQFDFQANMGPIKTQVQDLQKTLGSINLPPNVASNFEKLFGKLDSEMSNFQAMTKNGFNNMADVNKAQTAFGRITKIINQIGLEAQRVRGIDPNKLIPKEAQAKIEGLTNKLKELQSQQAKKNQFAEQIKKQNDLIKKQEKELQDLETKRRALQSDAKSLGGQKGAATKRRNEAQGLLNKAMADRDALIAEGVKNTNANFQAAKKDIDTYSKAVRDAQNQIDTLTNKLNTNATQMRNNGASTEIAQRRLNELQTEMTEMQGVQVSPQGLLELRQELAKLMGVNLDDIPNDLKLIQSTIDGLKEGKLNQLNQNLLQMDTNLDGIGSSTNNARNGMQGFVQSASGLNEAAQDMENFKNQFKYFFSMTNSVQLFRRAVTSALNTVKELDKTMTEAAVVTDFTVGDMWEKLPQYSANAQKLGVSINGMYQATTLYYQQGLKTNEAMAIGIETMKMARIAGMESSEATEAMTAALRGFNMELNETSAVRVNDVYSQLAAVTAADTEQIATAMSKTASIAANANMEFETTAALLAQIIETTQEAPETAGTALKTIIARFSEVKKLQNEGNMTGEDSEGEIIDVNKIQTALRTVGISMEGFFKGTEGLDSIFLKLAEKWDTLDFETQRYIATMAAGSRQQSRFIAMMSDYSRTTELVGEAQNSAGASQRQFNKTLDSMETKLQKLENAWNQFLMGLTNNEILKGAVDILTLIIDGINKMTNALSGGNGLIKSITSLITVVGALKLGGSMLKGGFGLMGSAMGLGAGSAKVPTGQPNAVQQMTGSNVYQQGEVEGQRAATGFKAGWDRAMNSYRGGKGFKKSTVSFFSSSGIKDEKNARKAANAEALAGKGIRKRAVDAEKEIPGSGKMTAMKEITKNNIPNFDAQGNKISGLDVKQLGQVKQEYERVYAATGNVATATDAANNKVREFGGTLMNTEEKTRLAGEQAKTTGFDFQAFGGAVMGAGMALGGLSMLFNSLGMEEEAEKVSKISAAFMGAGMVLSTLPMLAKALGISFEKAGVQISVAGHTAHLGWIWLGLITIAITGLILVGAALAKQEDALAKKGKELNAAYETFSETAEQAKENLEKIVETQKELEEMTDTFGGLAQGTTKWNQALIESNQKVLDLIKEYENLENYVEKGAYGQLVITDEGWEMITEQQQKKYAESVVSKNVIANRLAAVEYEQQVRSELTFNSQDDYYDIETLLKGAAQHNLSLVTDEEKIREMSKSLFGDQGQTFDYLMESTENLREKFDVLAQDTASLTLEKEMRNENLLNTIMDNSEEMKSKEFFAQISSLYQEGTEKRYEQKVANYTSAHTYNEDKPVTNKANEKIIQDYAGMQDMDIAEVEKLIEEGSLDYKAMAQALGIRDANKDLTKTLENMTKILSDIEKSDEDFSKDFNNLLTEGGSGLTISQLKSMEGNFDASKIAEQAAQQAGLESAGILAAKFNMTTLKDFQNMLERNYQLAKAGKERADAKIKNILETEKGAKIGELDVSSSSYGALAQNLHQTAITSGVSAASQLGGTIASMAERSGNQQGFIDVINSLNWESVDSVKSLGETLEALGLSSNFTEEEVKGLENQILLVADAERNLNLEGLAGELKKNSELLKDLEERSETDRAFSQEEYINLTKNYDISKDDFVIGASGEWIYIGNSMVDLTKAVKENTAAITKETVDDMDEKVAKAKLWEGISDQDLLNMRQVISGELPIVNYSGSKTASNVMTVNQLKSLLFKAGYEEEDLKGLTNDQLVEKLANDYNLYGSGQARESIYKEQQEIEEQASILSLQSQLVSGKGNIEDYNNEYMEQALKALMYGANGSAAQYELWTNTSQKNISSDGRSAPGGSSSGSGIETNFKETKAYNNLLKLLAINSANSQQKLKILSQTLDDNIEDFKKGHKGGMDYVVALENITQAAKLAFGDNITSNFVDAHRDLFIQLTQGGQAAENAYKQITEIIAGDYLKSLHKGIDATKALEKVRNNIDPNLEMGVTFEPDNAINALMDLGLEAAEAAEYLRSLGYEITYSTISVWEDPNGGPPSVKPVDGWEEIQVVKTVGTKVSDASSFTPSSGGGGGGSSNNWENSYDEFYNTVEKINEELRTREQLERRYQRLLSRNTASAKELAEITRDQLASLETELKDREGLLEGRKRQMSDIESEYSDVGQYAWYNEKTRQIEIRWDLLEGLDGSTDEELTSRIEEYISKLEEQQDKIEEEQDAIEEIKDAVWEIYEQGKDQYFDLENLVKEAIVAERQQEIDKLSEINESINDTSSKMLESMQEQLDEYRQNRDNQKTEEEIADKQRRLAYLQQDTSGANALEILRLQKEIDEATEDYTDTLIDQKISELQKQNDEAAEQRQQQIDIMQAQLDKYIESGEIWDKVHTLMEEGLNEENGLIRGQRLEELLKNEANWEGLSKLQQMNWLNELNKNIAEALAWLQGGGMQHLFGEGKEITFTDADGNLLAGTLDEMGNVIVRDQNGNIIGIYNASSFGIDSKGRVASSQTSSQASQNYQNQQSSNENQQEESGWPAGLVKPSELKEEVYWGSSKESVTSVQTALKKLKYYNGEITGTYDQETYEAIKKFQRDAKTKGWNPDVGSPDGIVGGRTKKAFRAVQYKTGGIADFTGPAWLDGTKSKPEYILNADQTRAFFTLVDVLSSLQGSGSKASQNSGDNTYDIDINVESIGSDYDVEQLADTIKRLINDDARYRNNNTINLSR